MEVPSFEDSPSKVALTYIKQRNCMLMKDYGRTLSHLTKQIVIQESINF